MELKAHYPTDDTWLVRNTEGWCGIDILSDPSEADEDPE